MMKHAIIPFLLFCMLSSCNHETAAIRETAYNYSYAVANYAVDNAEDYATAETRHTTLARARQLIKAIDTNYIISDTPAQIEILAVKITNDTEAYAVYHKTTPIKDFTDTLQLRKRKGQWYAHAPVPIVHLQRKIQDAPDAPKTYTPSNLK